MIDFKHRVTILCVLIILFLAVYGIGRQFSPAIVAYVVEEALVQKAPAGMSPLEARRHFDAWFSALEPDHKLTKLLELSRFLEKVQILTPDELKRLLAPSDQGRKPRT
jgi:hypothetical protein